MESVLSVNLSQLLALSDLMEVVANNIANANTTGFKGDRLTFREYLMQDPDSAEVSLVQEAGVYVDHAQGPATMTGGPFDFAIEGEGFFVLETPDGPRYTRAGHFQLDAERQIVSAEGFPVRGEGGQPLALASEDTVVEVSQDGTIAAESGVIGRLEIVRFENLDGLAKRGGGLFESAEEPVPVTEARILQGALEESNVQPVLEITSMIELVRQYQSAQRSNEMLHELQRQAVETLLSTNSA